MKRDQKQRKKLTLRRMTVRHLDPATLQRIAGGTEMDYTMTTGTTTITAMPSLAACP